MCSFVLRLLPVLRPFVNWQPALKLNLVTARDWERMLEAEGFVIEEKRMVGDAVYPGCRWWAAKMAAEKRKAIFGKLCRPDASPIQRKWTMLRAWFMELLYCRSVLLTLSRLKLRDFVLITAHKA